MLVKVTKKMAATIDKRIRPAGMRADYIEFTPHEYAMRVDCMNENRTDYRPDRGTIATIRIMYPASYYTMPQYLTTAELTRIFRRTRPETLDDFLTEVETEIAV